MRAGLYTRVSTTQQVDGISLQLQEERLRAYATAQGWEVVEVYEDAGLSGASSDRPEYQRMMADAKARRIDVILVYKLDRLTRSVRDFHELADLLDSYGVGLVSVTQNIDTSSPTGRLLRNILVDFANFERELIAERSTDAKRRKAAGGQYLGWRPPYGYRKVGERSNARLEIVPEEAEVVRRIYRLYLTGEYGVIPIARQVGLSTSRVREILVNPTYTGKIAYAKRPKDSKRLKPRDMDNWIVVDGDHEPIISERDFERAQEIRQRNFYRRGPTQGGPHLFSQMVYCARCGNVCRLSVSKRHQRGRTYTYMYYRCDRRDDAEVRCSQRPIRHSLIEETFLDVLRTLVRRKSLWSLIEEKIQSAGDTDAEKLRRLETLARQRAQVVRRIDNLVANLADGALATAIRPRLVALEEERRAIDEEMRRVQREMDEQQRHEPSLTRDLMLNVEANWCDMTVEEKREGVRLLVQRFVIDDGSITIHWTDRNLKPSKRKVAALRGKG